MTRYDGSFTRVAFRVEQDDDRVFIVIELPTMFSDDSSVSEHIEIAFDENSFESFVAALHEIAAEYFV